MALSFRKRGTKWEYRFDGAKIDGKRQQITKGGFKTKKEAELAGTKALAEYNNVGRIFTESELSVNDYMKMWLEQYCKTNVKQTTYDNYEKKTRLYIIPKLGKYKLKSITPLVIQDFINELFNEGYSRNTLSVIKGILTSSFNYAIKPLELIKDNPAKSVNLPSGRAIPKKATKGKEKEIVTQEQMKAIFERFPIFHSCHLPLQLAYRCGMRLGEIFALTWDDIDFNRKTISINKQVQNINGKWCFSNPKYDSNRIISIDNTLLELLKLYKEKQEKAVDFYDEYFTRLYINEKKELNTDADGEEIKLINIREDGTYIQPRVTQHCCRIIHYQLGYEKFDFHSLRHTHTTMLLENGANPKDVQLRLGHKNIAVTLQVYTHVTNKMQDTTNTILNSIF